MQQSESLANVHIGLVVTDPLREQGLRSLLEDRRGYRLTSMSSPRAQDLAACALLLLDAASTDRLLELIATIRRAGPHLRIVVLGPEAAFDQIERIIGAGAKGYLSYAAREEELCLALDIVLDGSVWAPRKVLARLLQRAEDEAALPEDLRFTARELEVLRQLVLGRSNREIAEHLNVDEASIKAHLGRLLRKANVVNRTALSMKALELGWVD